MRHKFLYYFHTTHIDGGKDMILFKLFLSGKIIIKHFLEEGASF